MIVQELLKAADIREVVKVGQIARFDDMSEEEAYAVYSDFRDRLCNKEPKANRDRIMLGHMVRDTLEEEPQWKEYLSVTVYDKADMIATKEDIVGIAAMTPWNEMTDEEIKTFFDNGIDILHGYAFEFSEWKDILGWEVDPDNVRECGEHEFVSYILYEMSFNGYWEDEQEERRDELNARMEDLEKFLQLPEEEQKQHVVSFEEIKATFSKSEETEWGSLLKETSYDENQMRRDMMFNLQSEAKMMKSWLENR